MDGEWLEESVPSLSTRPPAALGSGTGLSHSDSELLREPGRSIELPDLLLPREGITSALSG